MRTAEQALRLLKKTIPRAVRDGMDQAQKRLVVRIQTKHLSGPRSSTSVGKQSGRLERNMRALPIRVSKGRVTGGVINKTPYASTHIGKRGRKTRISGKNKLLAIPQRAARDGRGVPRGGPLSGAFGTLHFRGRSLFDEQDHRLFNLVENVAIPARVDIEQDIERPAARLAEEEISRSLRRIT